MSVTSGEGPHALDPWHCTLEDFASADPDNGVVPHVRLRLASKHFHRNAAFLQTAHFTGESFEANVLQKHKFLINY